MFCPNCGTQNPDAAQTCSKCNFNIKGAAAPKFKGTMLMMNQPIPGAPPGVGPQPAAPPAPAAAPPPAAAAPAPAPGGVAGPSGVPRAAGAQSAISSKLKGTMVGVAPMSGGAAPSPVFPATAPMAAVPAPAAQAGPPPGAMGAPMGGAPRTPPPPGMGAAPGYNPQQMQHQPPAYAPPQAQQGVNPLGGTVAADGGFAAFAQQAAAAAAAAGAQNPYGQPGQYGGAPPQQQYGAPPGGAPYGAPPQQQYGSNPPPGGQQGYGAPPQGAPGYGGNPMAPQGGMMPYGGAAVGAPAPMAGTLPSAGAAGAGPTRRNALMTWLLPFAVMIGGSILAQILGRILAPLALLGSLTNLAGLIWYVWLLSQMVGELKAVTGNASFAWWPFIVPFYNIYWVLVPLRQEVTKAKQVRGVQTPTRGGVVYFFLANYALASDLNDMAR